MTKKLQLDEQLGGIRIIVDEQPVGWLMSSVDGKYLFEIDKVKYPLCDTKDIAIKMLKALINDETL